MINVQWQLKTTRALENDSSARCASAGVSADRSTGTLHHETTGAIKQLDVESARWSLASPRSARRAAQVGAHVEWTV